VIEAYNFLGYLFAQWRKRKMTIFLLSDPGGFNVSGIEFSAGVSKRRNFPIIEKNAARSCPSIPGKFEDFFVERFSIKNLSKPDALFARQTLKPDLATSVIDHLLTHFRHLILSCKDE